MGPAASIDAGDRIEALLGELRGSADPSTIARVEEILETLVDLYGQGLARIVAGLVDEGVYSEAVSRRLASDPLLSALFLLHRLHPDDVRVRVEEALAAARPLLAAHAGGVTLINLDAGIARVRLEGTCSSCASSAATVHGILERAVREAAPEIATIEVVRVDRDEPRLLQLGRRGAAPGAQRAEREGRSNAEDATEPGDPS